PARPAGGHAAAAVAGEGQALALAASAPAGLHARATIATLQGVAALRDVLAPGGAAPGPRIDREDQLQALPAETPAVLHGARLWQRRLAANLGLERAARQAKRDKDRVEAEGLACLSGCH